MRTSLSSVLPKIKRTTEQQLFTTTNAFISALLRVKSLTSRSPMVLVALIGAFWHVLLYTSVPTTSSVVPG